MPSNADAVIVLDAEWIRTQRARARLTQMDLAHALGVQVSTINRWEQGHAQPSRLAWRALLEWSQRQDTGAA